MPIDHIPLLIPLPDPFLHLFQKSRDPAVYFLQQKGFLFPEVCCHVGDYTPDIHEFLQQLIKGGASGHLEGGLVKTRQNHCDLFHIGLAYPLLFHEQVHLPAFIHAAH